ncbi:PadR family transcriptional regulator [Lactococcus paracarnosus]|uniref:PadR family transcriptional regulator n=1 Tax=Pseudolactococcus paracarnosus TaxID=2749962 RepID=A0A7L4WHN3_9LACT|nr:PadR family transcriptional regulator [Lactococcus paracarnosus]MCJ1976551.1 PadR family transcriptional regulator [Lactococcus paracarnosus]MCJ1982658.1 PadR family transcriptional regulator [Lactococcus paracarnosus]MCJ1994495.1 PadR family transcriptional regulator [Lactococcus paracarnosus]MCJ1999106.1 PadR family transcriptional regulator [Lactococcus paracarnosus]QDJ29081.1 PadR family transcriptional regulator [Lactococcus paracarnosus]
MRESQMLKGILDGCVLRIIANGEVYGYELIQKLKVSGFETAVGGTIYPILQKLEKNGDVSSVTKKSAEGPDRKYFQVTAKGLETLAIFWGDFERLTTKVTSLWEEDK